MHKNNTNSAMGIALNIYTSNTRIIWKTFYAFMVFIFFLLCMQETVLMAQEADSFNTILNDVLHNVAQVSLYLDTHAYCTVSELQGLESALSYVRSELLIHKCDTLSESDVMKLELCISKLSKLLIRISDMIAQAR
jgi:hypothetical protein